MKPSLLLLPLALLAGAGPPAPPKAQVTFTKLTRAAYEQARKAAPAASKPGWGEKPTFPVRKQQGRLVVPTAAGDKVFRDKVNPQDETEGITYEYRGFFPKHQQHVIGVQYYESSEVLLVEPSGNVERLVADPLYAPNQQRLAAVMQELVAPTLNRMQLAEKVAGSIRVVWQLASRRWEPVQAFWTSDSTLCVKQRLLDPATEEAFDPARYTYARLLVRPAR